MTITPHEDPIFNSPDDDEHVTRLEIRKLARSIRNDIKWYAVVTVIGGQTLNHIQLPPVAGFVGGAAVVSFGMLKLIISR